MKPDSDIVPYLIGRSGNEGQKLPQRLPFYFNYLDNADPEISMDAFKEFANAGLQRLSRNGQESAGRQAGRLAARPQHGRLPHMAFMGHFLAIAGNEKDAVLLRARWWTIPYAVRQAKGKRRGRRSPCRLRDD